MGNLFKKYVLILGANSDVGKQCILQYAQMGYHITAASRNLEQLRIFCDKQGIARHSVDICFFDAVDFKSHQTFYDQLSAKPHIVVYAAGYLASNQEAFKNWDATFRMMNTHYSGAVSIINILVNDFDNTRLENIIGLSSLSGVRGRKSNFIYGSTKSAFTQYLAGLRQFLFERKITVNVIVAGYIRSKMTAGLGLPENLMLEPAYIAKAITKPTKRFVIVPGWKWKLIYTILRILPEGLVAKLP